jgi:hypothetical protein
MLNTSKRILKRSLRTAGAVGSLLFKDAAGDSETTVLLSSGRSGSTWLGDLICTLPKMRVIFEPFHPKHGIPNLITERYTYHNPSSPLPQLHQAFESLVTGRRRTLWTEQFNQSADLVYRRRILKLVRSNLLFPWLTKNFPDFRYIFLIRHPAAVVLSQLRGNWTLSAQRLLSQPDLLQAYDLNKFDLFGWPAAGFLSNMIFWAVENEIALRHAQKSGALIVYYENLCIEPQTEMKRIENYLGVTFPLALRDNFDRSSWSSRRDIGSLSANDKISKWTAQITSEELANVEAVLRQCTLSEVYGPDPSPLKPISTY